MPGFENRCSVASYFVAQLCERIPQDCCTTLSVPYGDHFFTLATQCEEAVMNALILC
jgi:hypothetical protein